MDSFSVNKTVSIDIKVKSAMVDGQWYLMAIPDMLVMIAWENPASVNTWDKFNSGTIHAMKQTDQGLQYFDQNCTGWFVMEENVQRQFSDYMADKELLGGSTE